MEAVITQNQYEIKLPQFEGPFDLLLFFIERDELDIHNIPISKITNDFFEYIQAADSMNIELASEFILVASTLMRIKAKMLLPRLQKDELGNEIDPRQDLVRQLLEYKQYKEAANELKQMEEDRLMKQERGNTQTELSTIAMIADGSNYSSELNALTLFKLMITFEKVMDRFRISEQRIQHTVVQYPFTVEQEKDGIQRLVRLKSNVSFLDIFSNCQSRMHACYTFLALLDLIQSKLVIIRLSEGFNNFFLTDVNSEESPAE
ncbi:MAG TPA: segregation/condensation protein A [Bacteroidia bacterium]|nr:segregation/condensation protein A [Bacteroidia bacterium]